MSLLSPEIRVSLLPDRVGLALGHKPVVVRVALGLQTLDALLAEFRPQGRVRATLSHHHARLFLLPPPVVRLRQNEMRPWLQAQLAESLGADAEWSLTWDPPVPGAPILVAAMASALLEDLRATLGRHGLVLAGARPWLAAAWQRRRMLWRASGWYALLEPGRMTLLRLAHGRPVCLRQRQVGAEVAEDLRALLARESLLAGVADGGELWLERAGVASDWACLRSGHHVHELAGSSDPAVAMLS